MPVAAILADLQTNLSENWKQYLAVAVTLAVIYIVGRLAAALVARGVRAVFAHKAKMAAPERRSRLTTVGHALAGAAKYLVYFIMLAAMLGALGLSKAVTTMLASVGIGGLAVGFGAQSLIKDVVTGLFLLFEEQISVGDYVNIAGSAGVVETLGLRTITVRAPEGALAIIPNGQIAIVTNYSRGAYTVYVDMPIAREEDIARANAAIAAAIEEYGADKPGYVAGFSLEGVISAEPGRYTLRAAVKTDALKQWEVERAVKYAAHKRLTQEGVALA